MASIRPKDMKALEPDALRSGEVEPFDPAVDEITASARVVDRVRERVEGLKLGDAGVVVATSDLERAKDCQESMAAFAEKRKPVYKWR